MSGEREEKRIDVEKIYEAAVKRSSRWRNRKREIKKELLGEVEGAENVVGKKVERAIRIDDKHDEMVTAITSAFNERSRLTDETGWYAQAVEPLYEVDPTISNPDEILGHDERDFVVIVECKTGLSKPRRALNQLRDAVENVLERRDYLEEQMTHEFEDVEPVLTIPGGQVEIAQPAIDQETREESPDQPVLLWTYHTFSEERLRLHRDFAERSGTESAHNSLLAEYLSGEGIEVINDPLASGDFYPESNPLKILRNVFFDVPRARSGSESSIRKFTRDEVVEVIDNPRTMTHYATAEVAEQICDDLLSRMVNYSLIIENDPEEHGYAENVQLYSYRDAIDGVNADTIQSNLVAKYKDKWIEQKAEKDSIQQTIDEFLENQSGLSDHF